MWGLILMGIIVADSILTVYIGEELNPIILYFMNIFSIDLFYAMILRTFLLAPVVIFLHIHNKAKITAILYVTIYISIKGWSFLQQSI